MTAPLRLDFTSNDADVIAAFKRQQKELEKERQLRDQLSKEIREQNKEEIAAQKESIALDKEAVKVIESLQSEQEKLAIRIDKINKLRDAGKLSSEQAAKAIAAEKAAVVGALAPAEQLGGNMAKLTTSVLSANAAMEAGQKVVEFIRQEYDRLIERQNRAASAQVPLAAAQEQAAFNLGEDPSLDTAGLFAKVREESHRLGMNERDLTMAVSDALSARGDADAVTAVEAVVTAAELRRFNPAELPGLSASALDISKGTGLDLKSSLGFLLQTGTLSRVTDLDKLSKNVAPAIIGGLQFGASREFSGGLTAALTQGIVDPTGDSSRTTSVSLLKQLREFGTANELGGVEATFKQLQGDESLRQSFFENASFEAKSLPAVEALFQKGSAIANQMDAAQRTLATQDPRQRFLDTVANRDAMPAARVAIVEQQMANLVDQVRLSDPNQAISGVVREQLSQTRDALGRSGISSRALSVIDDLRSGGEQDLGSAIGSLQVERNRLASGLVDPSASRLVMESVLPGFGLLPRPRSDVSENAQQIELLDKMLRQLESLNEQNQRLEKMQQLGRQAGVVASRATLQGESGS